MGSQKGLHTEIVIALGFNLTIKLDSWVSGMLPSSWWQDFPATYHNVHQNSRCYFPPTIWRRLQIALNQELATHQRWCARLCFFPKLELQHIGRDIKYSAFQRGKLLPISLFLTQHELRDIIFLWDLAVLVAITLLFFQAMVPGSQKAWELMPCAISQFHYWGWARDTSLHPSIRSSLCG